MNFKKYSFSDLKRTFWDKTLENIDGSTYLHSSHMINYYQSFNKKTKNFSFLVKDDESKFVACVVVVFTKFKNKNNLMYKNMLCPTPAIINTNYSKRNKIKKFIWNEIFEISKKFKIKYINFIQHPINIHNLNQRFISSLNSFETLEFLGRVKAVNTLILNLNKSDEELYKSISKYRKKDIKKAINLKINIELINYKDKKRIKKEMKNFRLAHYKSAKRKTRPLETWSQMENILIENKGKLFIATKDKKKLSYLFCGEFGKHAFGWSQVNYKKYEIKYPIRHYLEWFAIKYFQKKKFLYYDLGHRFFSNKVNKYTLKEIQISEFKEKYGGDLYPIINFESSL